MSRAESYDVIIIGGGVCGTALLHQLAKYTDISRIALFEKRAKFAAVNSHGSSNSQTIHCGDIETNYTLEKALKVKQAAQLLVNYAVQQEDKDSIVYKFPKMVLGVGEQECDFIEKRFDVFKEGFPSMELWKEDAIAKVEPHVALVNGQPRKEPIRGIGIRDEYCAVNYQTLSNSFVKNAQAVPGKDIDVFLEQRILDIRKAYDGTFEVSTQNGVFHSKMVIVSSGGHSLWFAHRMGYGLNFSCLPVAGSFYFTPKLLNGKVYTVQNDKLPFAAIHGDPDVIADGKTRFGPTALVLPMLERYDNSTIKEFFQVLKIDKSVMKVFWDLIKEKDIRNYMFKNAMFEVPWLRRRLFLKDVQKIVPSLKLEDLKFAKGFGGIRPQLIDRDTRQLMLGEAKINEGDGIIFNMTPSPGGTSALWNSTQDARLISEYLGQTFDESRFQAELGDQQQSPEEPKKAV